MTTKLAAFLLFDFSYSDTTSRFLLLALALSEMDTSEIP